VCPMRVFTLLTALGTLTAAARAEPPPLIPREVLFGNPDRANPNLSPDGRRLAYLRPDDKNVLQVWVRTLGKNDDAAVTNDPKRGIRQYFWAYDNTHLLYLQDADGDENFHLYAVNPATKQTRDLTPYPGVRAQGVSLERKKPGEVVVGLNKRNKAAFDAHRIDIATGKDALDTENPGTVISWVADADLAVRAGTAATADGGFDLLARDKPGDPWKKLKHWTNEEQGQAVGFGPAPTVLYVIGNDNANTMRLVKLDAATGAEEVVAADAEYDVAGAMIDETKRVPQAVAFTRARTEWKILDESIRPDFEALAKVRRGDFTVVSRTLDDAKWVVSYTTDDGPATYYLYDRSAKKAEFLFSAVSKLEGARLAQTEPIEFPAKDGLTVRGYLTRPVGLEGKTVPMVLLVHGGPWARDQWGYSPMVQWLANRGYAVLQVNYRGSTGYGKKFLNAGNREWAGKMHQDLLDGVDYVVARGGIDKDKVAIMGGSYGGYATLVGLTFTPDRFACGVDIVGPSNIVTLLNSIPPYWGPMKAMFAKRVGDPAKDKAFLEERSPLTKVGAIKKPLLIGQGANDPRVKQAESDQIARAMRAAGKEVRYVVYPDEGHGFARPENRLHFYAIAEEFLAKHLGGRAEPAGDVKGHTGQEK
jgi:dipeptidyl aminopeptidase/acylaminoacyl peptidase